MSIASTGRRLIEGMTSGPTSVSPGKYGVANRGLCLLIAYTTEFFNTGTSKWRFQLQCKER